MCSPDIDAAIERIARAAAVAELSVGDYAPTRNAYQMEVGGYINEYLYTDKARVTKYVSGVKRAIVNAFYPAFEQGLLDGGGTAPAQGDDLEWINSKVEAEFGFVEELFQRLKDLKKQVAEEGPGILSGVANKRSEGYARALDGVYSEGKIRGAKNIMLTFGGPDGNESCKTCQKLKGKRHRASWWKNHGLTIYRGNANYDCGCWQCEHFLFDDKGNVYTL